MSVVFRPRDTISRQTVRLTFVKITAISAPLPCRARAVQTRKPHDEVWSVRSGGRDVPVRSLEAREGRTEVVGNGGCQRHVNRGVGVAPTIVGILGVVVGQSFPVVGFLGQIDCGLQTDWLGRHRHHGKVSDPRLYHCPGTKNTLRWGRTEQNVPENLREVREQIWEVTAGGIFSTPGQTDLAVSATFYPSSLCWVSQSRPPPTPPQLCLTLEEQEK